MSLISKTIPNLINGVSQQPAEVRLPSQCDEQVNFLSSVVDGLKRRPGTKHLAKLLDSPSTGAFVHLINRDRFEKYVVVVIGGNIRVFDFEGNERTVNKPHGIGYLTAFNPAKSIRAVTVADYTFIVNRERITRAYDPSAGLTLTPVNQKFQTLRFNSLSKGRVDKYFEETNKWQSCWGRYSVTIAGKTYSQSSEYGVGSFAAYLAAKLTQDLGRPCIVNGVEVDIPLNGSETGWAVTDRSGNGSPVALCQRWEWNHNEIPEQECKSWTSVCEIAPEKVLTSLIQTKVVGYASANGDLVPAAEVTNKEGIVHIRLGDYGTTYKVLVNGSVKASFTTSATDRSTIGTDNIAVQLYNQLASAGLSNIAVSVKGNAILLRATNATTDFTLTVQDSNGNKSIVACKGRVQQFTDLPATAFEGFTIRVAGQDGVEADDYYVQYSETTDGEKTSGSWKEVAKKGLRTRPSPNTMPHRLVSNADGTFTFERIEWDGRVAGDETSAPEPSFINKAISDVFFFKNRLGFLADENVVFSESGSYYNFYPTTVIQSLDTHPIDVAVTNDKVSILRHAVPFNETLLLFSDQTQFIVRGSDRLTKETINIDVTTRFEASLDAKPVGAGKNVFFGVRRGPYASVREYYVDPEAKVNDAADIASHCPDYIYGSVVQLAASSNEDVVLTLTDADPSTLYAYKYYWQGNEKVQSSWSKWQFGGVILGFSFESSDLVLVIARGDKVYLERMSLATDDEAEMRGFKTGFLLDRLTYLDANQTAPWTSEEMVAVDTKGNVYSGDSLSKVLVNGVANTSLCIGSRFNSFFQFSRLVLTDSDTRVAPLAGRLQLRFMTLNYVNTGYFRVGVRASTKPENIAEYNGRRIGGANNLLGEVPIDDGRYRFPILGLAKDTTIWIESDSHLPCAFLSAEWEGLYQRHSRRV